MDNLVSQRKRLNAEIAQKCREINRLGKQSRRLTKSGIESNLRIKPYSKLIVLILYALCGHAELAVEYLRKYKKRYHKVNVTCAELRVVIENWVVELPQDQFNSLLEPETDKHTKALNAARKFQAEHAAVVWIEGNNERKGVAPATEYVMAKYDDSYKVTLDLPDDEYYDERRNLLLCKHRMFAVRLRRRWKISVDRLRENGVVPLLDRQMKVSTFYPRGEFRVSFLTPFSGAKGGPRKLGRQSVFRMM